MAKPKNPADGFFIGVSSDGARLVTKDSAGNPMHTLYYFPLQSFDPNHGGPAVSGIPLMGTKLMGDWLNPWMKNWVPLTLPNPGSAPPTPTIYPPDAKTYRLNNNEIIIQLRGNTDGAIAANQYQVMFRNWYLYTYEGDDGASTTNGIRSGLWQAPSPTLQPLKPPSNGEKASGKRTVDENVWGGP